MRSVAGSPTSAESSTSSSASMVSTSAGTDRLSGASARVAISTNRPTICCVVRARPSRILPRKDMISILSPGFRLGPLGADHQLAHGLARAAAPAQHLGHLRRDGQLDAGAPPQYERRVGGAYAFRDHLHAADDLGQGPPLSELQSDVTVSAQGARAR